MLLTITTTHVPATDLGYLLAKNPSKVQSFSLAYGTAHVFYPETTEARCTAALLLDIDPIGLVRGRTPGEPGTLSNYVNDRPYAASSLLSVALGRIFGSAMGGRCREKPELADQALPLEAVIESMRCAGGEGWLRKLFEPLGYEVRVTAPPLDTAFPDFGPSATVQVRLSGTVRLADLLTHLYVLIPVLDDEKHYWIGDDEVAKLLTKGEGWLASHPEKEQIAFRYLKHRRNLQSAALAQLATPEEAAQLAANDVLTEARAEAKRGLNDRRMEAVTAALLEASPTSVIDLGCGEGRLVRSLLAHKSIARIAGVDVSPRTLDVAARRLHLDDMPPIQRKRVELFQAALTYRDQRLAGYDAAALVEVIEHVDLSRLPALERTVFEYARPRLVVVTTPNAEYNAKYENLFASGHRHADHRFEWTRAEYAAWAARVSERYGYDVELREIGDVDPDLGAPTQMALFRQKEAA